MEVPHVFMMDCKLLYRAVGCVVSYKLTVHVINGESTKLWKQSPDPTSDRCEMFLGQVTKPLDTGCETVLKQELRIHY